MSGQKRKEGTQNLTSEIEHLPSTHILLVMILFGRLLLGLFLNLQCFGHWFSTTIKETMPITVEKQKIPTDPTSCLDDWIGYHRKCFYFSENTTTWGASQNFCASYTASLAVFNTTKELDFLKRYTDHSHYWIGLSREQGAEWQWADGTVYSSRLKITGKGLYAYLHKNGISSASSHLLKKWICSRPDAFTTRN